MLPGEQTQECAHESSHMTSSYPATIWRPSRRGRPNARPAQILLKTISLTKATYSSCKRAEGPDRIPEW